MCGLVTILWSTPPTDSPANLYLDVCGWRKLTTASSTAGINDGPYVGANVRIYAQTAFTLVELLVVLVIIGLLMSVTTLSFKGPYQAAQLQNAVEQMQLVDRHIRDYCRRHSLATDLVIDLDAGTIEIRTNGKEQDGLFHAISNPIKLDRVWTAQGLAQAGRIIIHVSPLGQSRTYAIRLRNAAGATQWVLFAGITGKSRQADLEHELSEIFDVLASARPDAT